MSETIKQSLNRADLNTLADQLRTLAFGDIVASLPTTLRQSAAAVGSFVDPATNFVVSAQDADTPACAVLYASARAGAGTPGVLTIVAYGSVPAAGEICVAPNGQLVTATADAWTDLDVVFVPEKGTIVEVTANVSANTLTLPTNVTTVGACTLMECTVLTGGSVGAKFVELPGTAPAAGSAALNAAKTTVAFNAGDAVTSATVKLLVSSSVDVAALLASTSSFV
jgi:hypothetical protein